MVYFVLYYSNSSITNQFQHSGGDPNATIEKAAVVLVDHDTDQFTELRNRYHGEKHIESYLWVKKCVEQECTNYSLNIARTATGRRPGEECVIRRPLIKIPLHNRS
jgi:hypothetical protein